MFPEADRGAQPHLFFHHEADDTPVAISAYCASIYEPSRTLGDKWRRARPHQHGIGVDVYNVATQSIANPHLLKFSVAVANQDMRTDTINATHNAVAGKSDTDGVHRIYAIDSLVTQTPTDKRAIVSFIMAPVGVAGPTSPESIHVHALIDSRAYGAGTYMLYAGKNTIVSVDVDDEGILEGGQVQVSAVPHDIHYTHFANEPLLSDVDEPAATATVIGANYYMLQTPSSRPTIGQNMATYRSNADSILGKARVELDGAEESLSKASNDLDAAESDFDRWRNASLESDTPASIVLDRRDLDSRLRDSDEDLTESRTKLKQSRETLRRWKKNAKRYKAARKRQKRLDKARGQARKLPKLSKKEFSSTVKRLKKALKRYKKLKSRRKKLKTGERKVINDRKRLLRDEKRATKEVARDNARARRDAMRDKERERKSAVARARRARESPTSTTLAAPRTQKSQDILDASTRQVELGDLSSEDRDAVLDIIRKSRQTKSSVGHLILDVRSQYASV